MAKQNSPAHVALPFESVDEFQANEFSANLLAWFDQFGRHDLPWQKAINPYRVWVSEIMLQQTQVVTVIPYYQKFMQRFPTIADLAQADQEEVLAHWAGLGYYARGRNLHKSAQWIVEQYQGEFPTEFEQIVALPGIGRSTAGAILSIALGQRFAILDGNVKRVLSRFFAIDGWPGERRIEQAMWQLADKLTPERRFDDYTQAIMDLGATLCKRSKPDCQACPVAKHCKAYELDKVSDYPYRKPQKSKPSKQACMLVFVNEQQQLLLEKRPQNGIWGGLWSLPEFESEFALQEFLQSRGLGFESLVEWPNLKHSFSHYHLQIRPMYLNLALTTEQYDSELQKVAEPLHAFGTEKPDETKDKRWLSAHQVASGDYALPAPISKVLDDWCALQAL
ncbi:A/G-specific adenine glycosylase [Thiomicrorhabdus sediminis]|uniref:Adenine DNA glycosylase n=1 Tax=Thiomicrorhabdus sediminis TaxID=2580412 RepID=A0A4V1HI17_9GAMM|nr:A/G-specific adenine glycosylase [Thiomicrorhabdus sediminis]QCU90963.1 A/G-specific adenine glycosylase [Thiomicrorhabdus sediminis]